MTDIEELQDCLAEVTNIRYRLEELGIENPNEIIETCKKLERLLEKEVRLLKR